MDSVIAIVLFGIAGAALYFWLQKRKEPKESVILPGVSEDLFNATVEDLMRNTKAQLITIWSNEIIASGGNYVPPTLGDGMTKKQISEEIAALRLGGRP